MNLDLRRLARSDLGDSLLEESVPANGATKDFLKNKLHKLEGVLGLESLTGDGGVNETRSTELLEELAALGVENLLDIVVAEDVVGVVRSENWDGDLVVALELRLGEQTLESGRRTADGDSGGAHSRDVCSLRGVDAAGLVEVVQSRSGALLVGAGDNGRPAVRGAASALERVLGNADAGTSPERDLDSLNSEGDEFAERTSRGNDGGSDETSAETDGAGVGNGGKLSREFLEVAGEGSAESYF